MTPEPIETFERTPDEPSREWLADLLRRHGVSLVQAASWLRVSDRAVGHWIAGRRRLTWAHAELLRRMVRERFRDAGRRAS